MKDPRAKILLLGLGIVFAGYAGCTEGGGSAAVSSSSSSSSPSASSGGDGDSSGLAAACAADTDCAPDLHCVKPDDNDPVFRGGPANGYCSKTCSLDIDCLGGIHAVCLSSEGGLDGRCVATCELGPPFETQLDLLDPSKCHGRNDLRCSPIDQSVSACLPTCGQDSQCPPGRACDPRLAVCVDKVNTGAAAGAKCDPEAKDPECAGICVGFSSGAASCSSVCVLGVSADPRSSPNCGGPSNGYCLYAPTGHGAGDFGYCAPACKQHDECQNPAFFCRRLDKVSGRIINNGYCRGAAGCPNGQEDCTDKTKTCTQTKFGKFCLDPAFPLGSAECGMGGGGGAGGECGAGGAGGAGGDAGAD